jgi:hypothetical protein
VTQNVEVAFLGNGGLCEPNYRASFHKRPLTSVATDMRNTNLTCSKGNFSSQHFFCLRETLNVGFKNVVLGRDMREKTA